MRSIRGSAGNASPRRRRWLLAGLLGLIAIGIWIAATAGGGGTHGGSSKASAGAAAPASSNMLSKTDVHIVLGNVRLEDLASPPTTVQFDGRTYHVASSLIPGLHHYLDERLDRRNSRYIGIVVMNPDTGRLLALTGFNKIDPDQNPCLTAEHPAASLFKIVTAAAAVEEKGYTAGTRFTFNGYKHTLYKRQLTDKTNRYTNSISLQAAFAQSVNPVFGKIGALYLDRQTLIAYGEAFAFNRHVVFELPWPASNLAVKEDPYHQAEIASGFNRQTTLSPLHGALIASAVVNGGVPAEPTLVDWISDDHGNRIYQSEARYLPAAISPQTAEVLNQLMAATVTSGTAKKIFHGYRRNKVLSRLKLGGKTGSIYNRSHDARFDWYVGYAAEKKGSEKLVVSVMVAHEEYIGIRAGQYARMAIDYYFKDYFAGERAAEQATRG